MKLNDKNTKRESKNSTEKPSLAVEMAAERLAEILVAQIESRNKDKNVYEKQKCANN